MTFAALVGVLGANSFAPGAPEPIAPVRPQARLIFQEQVARLETELAAFLQHRADAAGSEQALVDLQIDLRIIERWMLTRAAQLSADDPLPACAALRVASLRAVRDEVARRLQTSGRAIDGGQLGGLAKLHQLTYTLPELKGVGPMDEVCRNVGTYLILAGNLTPTEVNHLPRMRPQPIAREPGPVAPTQAGPLTVAELAARVKAMGELSPALRRQLESLAAAASAPVDPADKSKEVESPRDVLGFAVDLADGLARGTGVDPVARPRLEQQLSEGLALYTDVRTRPAGAARVSSLSRYRDSLVRIGRLRVPLALQQKLAPAFVWVNANPERGGHVLESIERYLKLCARADSRKEPPTLPPAQRKTLDGMLKQFAAHRQGFVDDAADLGGAGVLATGPDVLANRVESMRQLLDGIDAIERLPHAMQVLLTYRPKPGGALEKRANMAAQDLASPVATAAKEQSTRFVADAERLAQLAELSAASAAAAPPDLAGAGAARTRSLAAVESRRVALVGDLASQLATGKDLDRTQLARLETLRQMFDALPELAEAQAALAKADALSHWADWSIGAPQLRALVDPYREATAAAFAGFADDNATPLSRWPDVRKRFAPLLALVREVGSYADACAALPGGFPGELAKLLTPMDGQPFAAERYASLSIGIWQQAAESTDARAADGLFEQMLAKLRKDLHVGE